MREGGAQSEPSIMKALEIDNNLAQAHNALADLSISMNMTGTELKGNSRERLN
jgi:hypothetical protein